MFAKSVTAFRLNRFSHRAVTDWTHVFIGNWWNKRVLKAGCCRHRQRFLRFFQFVRGSKCFSSGVWNRSPNNKVGSADIKENKKPAEDIDFLFVESRAMKHDGPSETWVMRMSWLGSWRVAGGGWRVAGGGWPITNPRELINILIYHHISPRN